MEPYILKPKAQYNVMFSTCLWKETEQALLGAKSKNISSLKVRIHSTPKGLIEPKPTQPLQTPTDRNLKSINRDSRV